MKLLFYANKIVVIYTYRRFMFYGKIRIKKTRIRIVVGFVVTNQKPNFTHNRVDNNLPYRYKWNRPIHVYPCCSISYRQQWPTRGAKAAFFFHLKKFLLKFSIVERALALLGMYKSIKMRTFFKQGEYSTWPNTPNERSH